MKNHEYAAQTILDIESSTEADAGVVEAKITAFNKMEVPFTQVFGVLEDCPPGHKRYYLKKKL